MALARLQMGSLDGDEDGGSWQLNEALESPGADTYDTRESSLADRVEAMSREKEEATKVRVRGIMERALQDPFTKNRKVILLKAWFRWCKMLPLNLKCDELALQLQDRLVAFSSLRDSYYRDVVSVKLHLDKVANFKFGSEESKGEGVAAAKALQNDLYSVHALPNINFQTLIDRARVGGESSTQVLENLIQAGLMNVTTGKMFNPWEKSKAFNKIMKQKKGAHFKPPKSDGESITSAVPQTHELFIKYCKSCIGVMQFNRTWNAEVEHSMHMTSVTNAMEKEIADLKHTIVNLSRIIEKEEIKIHFLEAENKKLSDAGDWMGKWTYQKESFDREATLQTEINLLKLRQGMLAADLESAPLVFAERQQAEHERIALKDARLNSRLAKEVAEKEEERHMRMVMLENLSVSEKAGAEKDDIIVNLRAENADQNATLVTSRETINTLQRNKEDLTRSVEELTAKFDKLKQHSEQEADDLRFELDTVKRELDDKNSQMDSLYSQIRDDRSVMNRLQARCDEFDEIKRKEVLHQMWLASRPKYKLKTIAVVVRTAVRLSRAIAAGPPYLAAGSLGRRLQLRLVHESYEPALAELEACKITISNLDRELQKSTKEVGDLTYKNATAQAALATMREQNKGLQGTCTELRAEIKSREDEITKLNMGALAYCKKIDQIKRVLHRHRVSSHMQRVLTRSLSRSLTRIHAVLRSFTPENLPVLPPSVIEEDLARKAASAAAAAGVSAELFEEGSVEAGGLEMAGSLAEQDGGGEQVDDEAERVAREAAIAAAKAARHQYLKAKFRTGIVTLVKWLKIMARDRPFEAANLRLPVAYSEALPSHEPNKDFDKQFKETSKKLLTTFLDERKKIGRQVELALVDAHNASSFAATARQVTSRYHEMAEELLACKRLVQNMRDAEVVRLLKEAKAKRKAEAKKKKEEEKLARLKEKQAVKQASKKNLLSNKAAGGKRTPTEIAVEANDVAAGSVVISPEQSVVGDASVAVDEGVVVLPRNNVTTAAEPGPSSVQRSPHAPQSGSAYVPKPVAFMSMSFEHGGGGGGAPSGKAKQEVDLSFLDRPERAAPVKKAAAPVVFSDTEDEDDEEDEEDEAANAQMEMIDQLEEEVQELQLEKHRLLGELEAARNLEESLNGKIGQQDQTIQGLQGDLRLTQLDLDAAKQRIRLLRDAIEDNYRQRSAEIDEIRRAVAAKEIEEAKQIKAARRHRGTQIACAVCAIRGSGLNNTDDDVGQHGSIDTGVTVNQGFTEALQGDFVLMARPKNINAVGPVRKDEGENYQGRQSGKHASLAVKVATATTTHFSDFRESKSQSQSQSPADPRTAQAQEIAYALSRSKAQLKEQYIQSRAKSAGASSNKNQSRSGGIPESLQYGTNPQSLEPSVELGAGGEGARPHTSGEQWLYEPGTGYADSRGHYLDEDGMALPSQLQASMFTGVGTLGGMASGIALPTNSAAQGVRDAYEIRRTETNTAAFLQQQLLEGIKRPRSSIPSVRAPAPVLDALVHKRQLAPVPTRSQSATELINHLRRTVALSNSSVPGEEASSVGVSLVGMGKKHEEDLRRVNILTPSGTIINIHSEPKGKGKGKSIQPAWTFSEGLFEHHTGGSVVESESPI